MTSDEYRPYGYDGNGNIMSIGSGIVLRWYEYDALGQMTVERDRYTNSTTLYTYDNGGNLLQKAVYPDFYGANGTPTVTTYAYDNSVWADQLTNYNGTAITYDNSGNPLNWRNGLSFTWQNGRQLASAANDTTSVAYTYNQNGIRTSKTVNGVKTTYILDENDQLMGEITGEDTIAYLYDEGNTAYGFLYNDTPYFYLFNAQGDVVNVVDETGAVVATYNYDAWGNVISATGTMATINPVRYRGYYYDAETEFYYLQSRYYDATVGRFLNADSVFDEGYSLIGFNMYTYARNTPTMFSDPTGEKIILQGIDWYRRMLLFHLQKLTNDQLTLQKIPEGYSVVYKKVKVKKHQKELPVGTRLLRELMNNRRLCVIKYTEKENPSHYAERSNSKITIHFLWKTKETPAYMLLAHELIHSYRHFVGKRIKGSTEYPYMIGGIYKTARMEEIFTVGLWSSYSYCYVRCFSVSWINENLLREEHNLERRSDYHVIP